MVPTEPFQYVQFTSGRTLCDWACGNQWHESSRRWWKISAATRSFGVPRIALHDGVSGRVTHGKNPGPKPYLTREEADFPI